MKPVTVALALLSALVVGLLALWLLSGCAHEAGPVGARPCTARPVGGPVGGCE